MEGLRGQLILLSGFIMLLGCLTLTILLNEYVMTYQYPYDLSGVDVVKIIKFLVGRFMEETFENIASMINVSNETPTYITSNLTSNFDDLKNSLEFYYRMEGRYVDLEVKGIDVTCNGSVTMRYSISILYDDGKLHSFEIVEGEVIV
ncbi:MAG: hypothetical protein DRP01_09110 [Archaeoglobales archaeon]|nr:MAG: hypothetical protein DRP01_09110 [Archaeoglobales archaeon]